MKVQNIQMNYRLLSSVRYLCKVAWLGFIFYIDEKIVNF